MLKKIISGAQTGADRGGLDFAIKIGLDHGGWCPKGRHAEDGTIPRCYNVQETQDSGYNQRTSFNVRDSDGTVIFGMTGEPETPGSKLTVTLCQRYQKPCLYLSPHSSDPGRELWDFIIIHSIETLNVAGSRASKAPEIAQFVHKVLVDALLT